MINNKESQTANLDQNLKAEDINQTQEVRDSNADEIEINLDDIKSVSENYSKINKEQIEIKTKLAELEEKINNIRVQKIKVVGSVVQPEQTPQQKQQNLFKEFFS